MSLLSKSTSLYIFETSGEINPTEIITAAKSLEIKDITNTKHTYALSFCKMGNIYSQELDFVNNILSFSMREDIKKISKHLIKRHMDDAISLVKKDLGKVKLQKDELAEIREGVIGELAIGVRPVEVITDFIWDFDKGMVYAEKGQFPKL